MATTAPETAPSSQTSTNGPLTDTFSEYVHRIMNKWKVPGMSLAVVDGEDTYAAGYGYATLPDTPATPDTLWLGGSTAKAHVAAALAIVIDDKKFPSLSNGWATTMSSLIANDFILQDEWATDHITLEDVICHRTGLPRHDKASSCTINGQKTSPKDITRNLRNLRLASEPRVSFSYCNTISGPLGMTSTYLDADNAEKSAHKVASGYYWDKAAEKYCQVPRMDVGELGAAGAIISTASDYAKWIKCLLHRAEPLSPAVHKDIRAPRMIGTTEPMAGVDISLYALGWVRTMYHGHVLYTHAGGLDAAGAQIFWLPDVRFGAVAFANTAMTSNAAGEEVIFRLIDEKLGIPDSQRFDFGTKWTFMIEHMTGDVKDTKRRLFPHHPEPPEPSSIKTSELTGTYHDAGYGGFSLREETHPENLDETILVADRDNMTWRYQFQLHHASGNDWVVYVKTPRNPTFMNEFHPGKVLTGARGEVVGLEINWTSRMGGASEGTTIFEKTNM